MSLASQERYAFVADLATTHGAKLRRFLLVRLRNPSDAADILQEVYLRMLRVPQVESIRSPEAYLFTVAQHVLQQHYLRESKIPAARELVSLFDEPRSPSDADPELEAIADQYLSALQHALDEVSSMVRATFLLHRRDGLSIDEIGSQLGISRAMVKKNLVKALMYFRQRLANIG
jgi:RNA polymerase sigma factor (sigma-70 family)